MRENLSVQSTKLYCTDSCIRLGTGAYRRYVTFPFPASPHFSQEGTNQGDVPSMSNNTAGAILGTHPLSSGRRCTHPGEGENLSMAIESFCFPALHCYSFYSWTVCLPGETVENITCKVAQQHPQLLPAYSQIFNFQTDCDLLIKDISCKHEYIYTNIMYNNV